jgi:hypothetical protein
MTKAKLVLTAVAVFAVVGGALAFKASKQPFLFYRWTSINANSYGCISATSPLLTTLNNGNAPLIQNTYYTTAVSLTTTCPSTTVFAAE